MLKRKFISVPRFIVSLLITGFFFSHAVAEEKTNTKSEQTVKEDELKPQIGRMGDPIGVDPETFEFSSAERKIWLDSHLGNVGKPMRLFYEFIREGSFEEGFVDSVYLDIIKINEDGSKDTVVEFFTEERQQKANSDNLNNVKGNPVIGLYMQGDVMEMNRLTKGSWRYFQRRIKFAISDEAEIETVSFKFDGKMIEGEKITFSPYVKDPRRNQFSDFANKRYEFIFSNQIPGSLYQITTVVPAKSDSEDGPLIKETLTLQNVEFRS